MPHHGMTPHTSGTSLSAQARYAAGTREILECWFDGRPIRDEYLIVDGGTLAGIGAHSYSEGTRPAAPTRPPASRASDGGAAMKMRAAVLEEFGAAAGRAGGGAGRAAGRRGAGPPSRLRRLPHRPLHRLRRRPLRLRAGRARPRGRRGGGEGRRRRHLAGAGRPRRHPLLAPVRRVRPLRRPARPTSAWRSASSRTRASCPTAAPGSRAKATVSATSWAARPSPSTR